MTAQKSAGFRDWIGSWLAGAAKQPAATAGRELGRELRVELVERSLPQVEKRLKGVIAEGLEQAEARAQQVAGRTVEQAEQSVRRVAEELKAEMLKGMLGGAAVIGAGTAVGTAGGALLTSAGEKAIGRARGRTPTVAELETRRLGALPSDWEELMTMTPEKLGFANIVLEKSARQSAQRDLTPEQERSMMIGALLGLVGGPLAGAGAVKAYQGVRRGAPRAMAKIRAELGARSEVKQRLYGLLGELARSDLPASAKRMERHGLMQAHKRTAPGETRRLAQSMYDEALEGIRRAERPAPPPPGVIRLGGAEPDPAAVGAMLGFGVGPLVGSIAGLQYELMKEDAVGKARGRSETMKETEKQAAEDPTKVEDSAAWRGLKQMVRPLAYGTAGAIGGTVAGGLAASLGGRILSRGRAPFLGEGGLSERQLVGLLSLIPAGTLAGGALGTATALGKQEQKTIEEAVRRAQGLSSEKQAGLRDTLRALGLEAKERAGKALHEATTRPGSPINPQEIQREMAEMAQRAGVKMTARTPAAEKMIQARYEPFARTVRGRVATVGQRRAIGPGTVTQEAARGVGLHEAGHGVVHGKIDAAVREGIKRVTGKDVGDVPATLAVRAGANIAGAAGPIAGAAIKDPEKAKRVTKTISRLSVAPTLLDEAAATTLAVRESLRTGKKIDPVVLGAAQATYPASAAVSERLAIAQANLARKALGRDPIK